MNRSTTCLTVLFLLALAAGPSLASGSKSAADLAAKAEGADVLVAYTAPLRQVVLTRDLHLADIEEFAEYANPVAAEPSATKTVRKEGKVSEQEAAELLGSIRESGFFNLKDSYGGRPQERNYPYLIVVWNKEQEKRVVYYSRPDAEPRPAAFAKTEQKILEFAQQKAVELKSGGK